MKTLEKSGVYLNDELLNKSNIDTVEILKFMQIKRYQSLFCVNQEIGPMSKSQKLT